MNSYPVFEKELEQALKEDLHGGFLREYQDALREFRDSVESHLASGLDKDAYDRWKSLQDAAETAGEAAARIRDHLLQPENA